MKLRKDQWIVLGMGIAGVLIALYLKVTDNGFGKFFPIFYAGTSMIWIAFINNRKSCIAKAETKINQKNKS